MATNGKKRGGKGHADRKDYPYFMGFDLQTFSKHIGHWEVMTEQQKAEVMLLTRAFVVGDEAKLAGRPDATFAFQPLPPEVREALREALREANRKPVAVED